jgi:hypothetical protein
MFISTTLLVSLLVNSLSAVQGISSDPWNELRQSAVSVQDSLCSSQLLETLEESGQILVTKGISEDFLESLKSVSTVAGDLPQAEQFRADLASTLAAYSQAVYYQDTGNVSFSEMSALQSSLDASSASGIKKKPSTNAASASSVSLVTLASVALLGLLI